MAPSFDTLSEQDLHEEELEIDFSDLKAQYEVRLEESLDAFVVIDGLPIVPEESKPRLIKFMLKKLNTVGRTSEDAIFMPMNEEQMTEGFAFVEYESPEQALEATKHLHGTPLDKKHTLAVNKLTDIDRYGREGRVDEEYKPPTIEPFREKDHLRSWLGDPNARDQFTMYRGDKVGVFWNMKKDPPENIVDRDHWTQLFVQWSPQGTYLASVHPQGVQLWGGPQFTKEKQFPHPFVQLIEFSPGESYLTTWSARPIQIEGPHPILSYEEDGKHFIIWDITTGKPLRSFVNHDVPAASGPEGEAVKKKIQWPAFKWSADEKYVARMLPGQSISVYELPRMSLLDKASIKIEKVKDFEWAPATPQREGIKEYEQLLSFWTPEMDSNPAKVGLMSIPSKQIVRTRNLFHVTDVKLHWQSQGAYLCVKVDRHSKSKKSLATNLEIFRVKEKGVPVEVVDSIKDPVINFAWEPNGDRFVLITTGEATPGAAIAPKTAVSFFCPEKVKVSGIGNFKLIRTIEKKTSNGIYWSPKGRFVVVATVHSQQNFDLDFWDLDFEGEKQENEKDLSANLQLMKTTDHYGVTDIDWDPTGRYVVSSASAWTHTLENGYNIHTFSGTTLAEHPTEKFKQFLWRPRPPTFLSKEEQKQTRKNLREYSREFDEEDKYAVDIANTAIVEMRKRVLNEWTAWVRREKEMLDEEIDVLGLEREEDVAAAAKKEVETEGTVVEEIMEEIIDETEEVIG
ncbi:eukaryotic translation initiation factor 3 subunit B [Paracoccidioides brasiliensis Pb03]|uniref:Eukaryotic translation initiation factor 3 subunit B n=2 Tax=Paracoccidioides brasiliensis TaxID=121759 RepID=C1GL26_PARBD|nr:eukaryotic translation initiation factor 3 subunit B [Paracoccidioides brasiliensis Pb18]EEH16485.2 eukaryotic translation initiation factor 3 subunit B [Paracoccidioides brasiliensis Pb03]EEH43213.1 eukaryotic translation initiation factor 3 subunit B [Paracoccidioides brasiliensis Pb18]ODH27416.1 eukaryotic translation initiation factor 3 subunit B [Paracoccidioides brasiliensis]ODH48264.1 eukaryotic translation initiation factor 3 subunit B [Paracoccidioides brasiliensis]